MELTLRHCIQLSYTAVQGVRPLRHIVSVSSLSVSCYPVPSNQSLFVLLYVFQSHCLTNCLSACHSPFVCLCLPVWIASMAGVGGYGGGAGCVGGGGGGVGGGGESCHITDFQSSTLEERYGVSTRTIWTGVDMLPVGEIASLTCIFYLSVGARNWIGQANPSLRCT